jgi:hypothetical protein
LTKAGDCGHRMPEELELDHVFVCADSGEAGAAGLIRSGFQPGIRRVHAGQGTANVCFFFDNAYLEVLWLRDEREIRSPVVSPLCLWERVRWRASGACPFGVAFRQTSNRVGTSESAWHYPAPFLPSGGTIPILTPKGTADEPLVFVLSSSAGPPSEYPPERRQPLEHHGRRHRVAEVRIDLPAHELSQELKGMMDRGLFRVGTGRGYEMRLRLESSTSGPDVDFRPELPLSFTWSARAKPHVPVRSFV